MNNGLFSSNSQEWETPQGFFDRLDDEFHFTLDPCATRENAKCPLFFTAEDDGLFQSWQGHTVFVNPPYGRQIGKWTKKALEEAYDLNTTVVMLIPSRTDTRWWHDHVMRADEIRFVKGRIRFSGRSWNAPFPNAVVVFQHPTKFPRAHTLTRTLYLT